MATAKRFLKLQPNGYFAFEDGEPFLPLGGYYGNFVHHVENGVIQDSLVSSIRDATEAQKRAWFEAMARQGVNCLRIMSRDHASAGVDEWDKVGAVNEPLLEAWEQYWAIAREYGLYILPTLHESFYADYAPYRNRDVMARMVAPLYTAEELAALPRYRRRFIEGDVFADGHKVYTDPDSLRCKDDYLKALIPRLRDNPSILFYELENEQEVGYFDWTNQNIDWIRRDDTRTPICISHSGAGLRTADPLPHSRHTRIDFYSYHVYPVNDGVTTKEIDYGVATSMTARYTMLGVPGGSGESGAHIMEAASQGPYRAAYARDTAWLPFLSGNCKVMFWAAGNAEAVVFKPLAEVARMLDLRTFRRKRPRIAVNVAHSLDNDQYFKTDAGYGVYQVMGRYENHFMNQGVEFDYTVDGQGYDAVLPGAEFVPHTPTERPFVVSPGYQVRHMTAHDDSAVVAYARNRGDYVHQGEGWVSGWLRQPRAAAFTMEVTLPGAYEGFLETLDTGERRDVRIDGTGRIDAGDPSDRDYLLFLKRA